MKYSHTVHTISKRAGEHAAIQYDVHFRKWRQMAPLDLPWDQVNAELFSRPCHRAHLRVPPKNISRMQVPLVVHPITSAVRFKTEGFATGEPAISNTRVSSVEEGLLFGNAKKQQITQSRGMVLNQLIMLLLCVLMCFNHFCIIMTPTRYRSLWKVSVMDFPYNIRGHANPAPVVRLISNHLLC